MEMAVCALLVGEGGKYFDWMDIWGLNPEWLNCAGWRPLCSGGKSRGLKSFAVGGRCKPCPIF